MEYINYFVLAGILIVAGIYLREWRPPIAPQIIAAILLVLGSILGWVIINNVAYGFLIAGLVYYKDELVDEVRLVKESLAEIKDTTDEVEEE